MKGKINFIVCCLLAICGIFAMQTFTFKMSPKANCTWSAAYELTDFETGEAAPTTDDVAPTDPASGETEPTDPATPIDPAEPDLTTRYELIYVTNNSTSYEPIMLAAGEEINLPILAPEEGKIFDGWYLDAEFTSPLTEYIMPASNLTIYAKWRDAKVVVMYISSEGAQNYSPVNVHEGESVSEPNSPTKQGSTFMGWYLDKNYTTKINFETFTAPNTNFYIFAKWEINSYNLIAQTNSSITLQVASIKYNEEITLPAMPKIAGRTFLGWYLDENFNTEFNLTKMPDYNLTIYAKWKIKQTISVNTNTQTYTVGESDYGYINFSKLNGFKVEYKVNGQWQSTAPIDIGSYDVRISRLEDADYAAYETIVESGLVIEPTTLNLNWLIALLIFLTVLEIVFAVVVRILRNMKSRMTLAAAIPFFSYLLPTNQFVLLIVFGVLALAMFVVLVYELVALHKTLPSPSLNESKQAVENFEESENDWAEEFKNVEPIGNKYTEWDIYKMLDEDNYRNMHKPEKNVKIPVFNSEENEQSDNLKNEINVSPRTKTKETEIIDEIEITDKNSITSSDYPKNDSSEKI